MHTNTVGGQHDRPTGDNKAEAAYYAPAEVPNARSIRQWRDRVAAVEALRGGAEAIYRLSTQYVGAEVDGLAMAEKLLRERADNLEAGL